MKSLVLFDTGIDGIGVIHLEDVADVFVADNSDETFARINGNPGIVLSFSNQATQRLLPFAKTLTQSLIRFQKRLTDFTLQTFTMKATTLIL